MNATAPSAALAYRDDVAANQPSMDSFWARHESMCCLLVSVAATLAIAPLERASGINWLAADGGNYAVEWLLLGFALGGGLLLHTESRWQQQRAPEAKAA